MATRIRKSKPKKTQIATALESRASGLDDLGMSIREVNSDNNMNYLKKIHAIGRMLVDANVKPEDGDKIAYLSVVSGLNIAELRMRIEVVQGYANFDAWKNSHWFHGKKGTPSWETIKHRMFNVEKSVSGISFTVPKDMRARAKYLADRKGISVAEYARQALEDKVEYDEDHQTAKRATS